VKLKNTCNTQIAWLIACDLTKAFGKKRTHARVMRPHGRVNRRVALHALNKSGGVERTFLIDVQELTRGNLNVPDGARLSTMSKAEIALDLQTNRDALADSKAEKKKAAKSACEKKKPSKKKSAVRKARK
jgi:hypothetical protein